MRKNNDATRTVDGRAVAKMCLSAGARRMAAVCKETLDAWPPKPARFVWGAGETRGAHLARHADGDTEGKSDA